MRVAVTGGAGKLGREVVRILVASGHSVRSIDRVEAPASIVTDLRDMVSVQDCLTDIDSIVHLAAWPTPDSTDIATVLSDNVQMASNVLFAAAERGVRNVVVASSQSVLGLAWATEVIEPDYLPVDERHPCRPSDSYSLSKVVTEQIALMLSEQDKLDAKVLRFPVIWDPAQFDTAIAGRMERQEQGAKSQWAYVDVRDAARAVNLALGLKRSGYELFNITSPAVFATQPTASLVAQWYPGLTASGAILPDMSACFDWKQARNRLGFTCRFRWTVNGIEDTCSN